MLQSTMEAYSEVDTILSLMDVKYIQKIPENLRNIFKTKKSTTYVKKISTNIPLKDQNFKKETLSILATLNYNYWCEDENRKKELMSIYIENERKHQDELIQKYNPDDLFKKDKIKNTQIKEENAQVKKENTQVAKIQESFIKIFFKKLRNIFKIK